MYRKFKPLNIPDGWEQYWSKYPNGYTIMEALIDWVSQVDDMVDNQNELSDTVKSFGERIDEFINQFGAELQQTVTDTLSEWQDSGFLNIVISEALQWELDDFKTTTEQNFLSVNEQLQQMAYTAPPNATIADINELITNAHNSGGGNIYFVGDYVLTPTETESIILKDNVNLVGNGKSTLKISNNNPNFDSLIKGVGGKIQNCELRGLIIDTNAVNNPSNIGLSNRRLIFHATLGNNIRFTKCRFYYSGMNMALITGAMYGHNNFYSTECYYEFVPQGVNHYDNTCLYIGVIGHTIVNNIFKGHYSSDFLKPRAVTVFESHSSYGIFNNNMVSDFATGVLLLGADYGTSDVTDKSLVQKIVANNIFRKMWNGITCWAGNRDVNNVLIDGNIIDINNKDRNRHSQNSYGVAFTHPMGGATMRNLVEDVVVSNNTIRFQSDTQWLVNPPSDEGSLYMGAFGIGALGRSGETVSLNNIIIEQNTIINSPRQPFVFANESVLNSQFKNIFIKNNMIKNPITTTGVDIHNRSLLLLSGDVRQVVMEHNQIYDEREHSILLKEVYFRGSLSRYANIRIMDNVFNQMDVGLAKDLPVFLRPSSVTFTKPDQNKLRVLANNDSLEGLTFKVNDTFLLRSSTSSRLSVCGKEGTRSELTEALNAVSSGNVITIQTDVDIPFKAGEFLEIRKQSDNSLIQATVLILAIDRLENKIIISLTVNDNVALNYSKPAFVPIVT